MESEEMSPYQQEVALSLEESLITSLINISQIQDIDMLDSYYNFLSESVDPDTIIGLIASSYIWLRDNDEPAFNFFHPIATKLVSLKEIEEIEKTFILEEEEEEERKSINLSPRDIAHILLEEGYKPKTDYKLYKHIIKIFNASAVRFIAVNFTMDSVSDFVKVCLD